MSIIKDTSDRIKESFDKGDVSRSKRRKLERDMKKRGATDDQIAHGLMLEGNNEKAKEVFVSTVKLLHKLGFDIVGKVVWHDEGAHVNVALRPMELETYRMFLEKYAMDEANKNRLAEPIKPNPQTENDK